VIREPKASQESAKCPLVFWFGMRPVGGFDPPPRVRLGNRFLTGQYQKDVTFTGERVINMIIKISAISQLLCF
jgi:hypothetical protein